MSASTWPQIVLLLGPTAAGKTALAMAVHDVLGAQRTQLISVDSAMVYRGMNIGTAKPSVTELAAYPHALIDLRDPAETYSAADFVADADAAVRQARAAGKLPVLVGGTMLYAQRFLKGIADLPEADATERAQLEAELAERGADVLHAELSSIDPQAAQGIDPRNHQRLLRALEVVRRTGQPMSQLWQQRAGADLHGRLGLTARVYALAPPARQVLHQRITQRFEHMLKQGFLDEVRALYARSDLRADLPAMRAVGYRQAWQHLQGLIDHDQFAADAQTATRRLAKRQLTWLRSWPDLQQLPDAPLEQLAKQIVEDAAVGD